MSSTGQNPDQEQPSRPAEEAEPRVIDLEPTAYSAEQERNELPPPPEDSPRHEEEQPISGEPPRRREIAYVAGGLVAALLVALGVGFWLYETAAKPNQEAIAALDERVAALERRLADSVTRSDEMAASLGGLRGEVQQLANRAAPDAAASGLSDRVSGTEQGIGELRGVIDDVRKTIASQAANQPAGASEAITGQLDQLSQRVNALDEKLGQPASPPPLPPEVVQKIEDLDRRLKEAEAAAARPNAPPPPPPAGAAYAQLAAKAQSGQPFTQELDAMVGQLPNAPGVDVLRAHAAKGAPRLGELVTALENIQASFAAPVHGSSSGMMDALISRLSSVVRVRRLGELDWGKATETALAEVKAGRLAEAVTLLGSGANPPDSIVLWVDGARARLAVDSGLATLSAGVLQHVSGSGS